MSESTSRSDAKTFAVRLPGEEHAQLVLVASLEGWSLNDTVRQAIRELIERKRASGDLAAQAAKALEDMEQEAQARKAALQALLGQQASGDEPSSSRGRSRRGEPSS